MNTENQKLPVRTMSFFSGLTHALGPGDDDISQHQLPRIRKLHAFYLREAQDIRRPILASKIPIQSLHLLIGNHTIGQNHRTADFSGFL